MPEANPHYGFIIYDVIDFNERPDERDITAEPQEGLGPLGVQFRDIEAEE